jgi:hypothetical protein
MFHAVIISADGGGRPAMEFSGEVAPYDLEMLRQHVRKLRGPRGVVRLLLHAAREHHPGLLAALRDLARDGVSIVFLGS